MKIRLKNSGDVRDVSSDVGDMMVSAGLADALTPKESNEYIISTSKTAHFLNWSAREGEVVDGMQYAPALVWRCSTCAQLTFTHPMRAPASQTVFHFEKQQCPDDVYQDYVKLFNTWQGKGKRRLKGTYERFVDAFGQRSNESLDRHKLDLIRNGAVVTL